MCGRYFIDGGAMEALWREIVGALNPHAAANRVKTSGEIFPTDTVPVIANSHALTPSVFAMSWGYTLPDGKRIINARSETAADKPLFRDGMARRRCVVPASHYFEWERSGGAKTKYAIRPEVDGVLWMAGLYRIENGRPAFVVLTRDVAKSIAFIHSRMPVILPAEKVFDWLDPQCSAKDLLRDAVLDVRYRPVPSDGPAQIAMEI